MENSQPLPLPPRPADSPSRCLGIAGCWVATVGSATWIFFGTGSGGEPFDALGFGGGFAIAGTTSAALVLGIGERRRWAGEILATASAVTALAALVAYLTLWAYPGPVRARLGLWPFRSLQHLCWAFGHVLPRFLAPLAAPTGVSVGLIGGLLALLSRRRPQAVMAAVVVLLLACSVGPVQDFGSGLVVGWGRLIRWTIDSPDLTSERITASGAISGALVGALLAGLASRLSVRGRPRRAVVGSRP